MKRVQQHLGATTKLSANGD